MLCQSCGVELGSDTPKFCPDCGSPVKASAQTPVEVAAVALGNGQAGKWRLYGSIGLLIAVGVAVLIKFGGGILPNSPVGTVRNGILADYPATTVGKAFEGTFQDSKWSSFVTPKGETVVQFDGTMQFGSLKKITTDTLALDEAKMNNCIATLGLAAPLEKLKRQADESGIAYKEKEKLISSQFQELHNPMNNVVTKNSSYDLEFIETWGEPFTVVSGEKVYPFKELDVARKAELVAEQQALTNLDEKIAACINSTVVPVKFQFVLSADKKTFELGYVDDIFGSQERALAFIYR